METPPSPSTNPLWFSEHGIKDPIWLHTFEVTGGDCVVGNQNHCLGGSRLTSGGGGDRDLGGLNTRNLSPINRSKDALLRRARGDGTLRCR